MSSCQTKTGTTPITSTNYTYNYAGLPVTKVNKYGTTTLESYYMSYYANGNMNTSSINNVTTTYIYDLANRLTRETVGSNATIYTYDEFGNRTIQTTPNSVTAYNYDNNNRLLSTLETAGLNITERDYTYDDNGNLLSDTLGQQTYTYEYSPLNRLVKATGTSTATYVYDGNGICQTKTTGGTTTRHIYDGSDLVCDKTGTSNPVFFTRGAELISFDNSSGTRRYYHTNQHGDISKITSSSITYKTYSFDAFGNSTNSVIAYNGSNFGYCGEYYDPDIQGVYLRARYYSPVTGRFFTEDPVRDGSNWYVYCGGNPVAFGDPWGLAPTIEEAAAMAEHIYLDIPLRDPNDPAGNKKQRTVAGWRLIDVFDGSAASSIKLGIYIPDEDDWTNPTEYALVYRGSTTSFDMETASVWTNNILAYGSSFSVDMWAAIYAGVYFDATHSQEITFVGHSKGGGEAIAAATATGNDAITFNAANFNFSNYGLVERNKSGINNYYVKGEILSALIGRSRYGTNHWLDTQYWKYETNIWNFDIKIPAPIENHGMKAVKEALS